MGRTRPKNPRDPDLRRVVVKLVRYLRDLTEQSRAEVLHLGQWEQVWWLTDLPSPLAVRETPDRHGALLAVPHVPRPLPPPIPPELESTLDAEEWADPQVAEPLIHRHLAEDDAADGSWERAHQRALAHRTEWISTLNRLAPQQRFHARLSQLARQLQTQDDQLELVLAGGLVVGPGPNQEPVARHLVTHRLQVQVDQKDAGIRVTIDPDAALQVEDRRFLLAAFEDRFSIVDEVRAEIEDSDWLPHQAGLDKLLASWSDRLLPDSPPYSPARQAPAELASPQLRVMAAPALVVRSKSRSPLVAVYDEMLQQLADPRVPVPLGLVQLLYTLDRDERQAWLAESGIPSGDPLGDDALFPLPSNSEQRHVLAQLRLDNGVVVQGPPGTGKTHTIANLVAALLAGGLRVLVVSQREQPLGVLRDKLPGDLQHLCLSLAGERRGTGALESSVRAMAAHLTATDLARTHAQVADWRERRDAALRRVETIQRQVDALLDAESVHHDVAEGYSGCLAEIAASVLASAERYRWFPALPNGAPRTCPLSGAEMIELRELLIDHQRQPDLASTIVPVIADDERPEVVASVLTAVAPTDVPSEITQLATKLDSVPDSVLAEWAESVAAMDELAEFLSAHAAGEHGWLSQAVADIWAGQRLTPWRELFSQRSRAEELYRSSRSADVAQVTVNEPDTAQWTTLLHQANELYEGLHGGRALRRWGMATKLADATVTVRTQSAFQGRPVDSEQAAAAVRDWLTVAQGATELARLWSELLGLPAAAPVTSLPWFAAAAEHLSHLIELDRRGHAVRTGLQEQGVLVPLISQAHWKVLGNAIHFARRHLAAQHQRVRFEALLARWRQHASRPDAPGEVASVLNAVEAADIDGYRDAVAALDRVRSLVASHQKRADLRRRLREAHPALAANLDLSFVDDAWLSRGPDIANAWAWAVADRFVRTQRHAQHLAEREDELVTTHEHVLALTADLAAEQGWEHCLRRMTDVQRRALHDYASYVSKQGFGKGKHTATYRRSARDAIRLARNSVPAWVMPINRVAETLPIVPNSFDVVIVDEASQAPINALFLLWLAPRAIVVGDDKQCTPGGGSRPLDDVWQRLRADFAEISESVRNKLAPNGNLYDVLTGAFPNVIRLTEHFRCMPEIIEWPSREFYDGELVPLRQFGVNRLPPIEIRRVLDGHAQGSGEAITNSAEARFILDQLAECLADTAYVNKTFGIITLQGNRQHKLIERMLYDRFSADVINQHEITVGLSADFQGDERHVMFVSTVASGRVSKRRQNSFRQAVNVAVTRAQDQLWIITSLDVAQLQPDDLRHQMITGFHSIQQRDRRQAANITQSSYPAFPSQFHSQVYRAILDAGFDVEAHSRVGNRIIDIVVHGAASSVAVLCDWNSEAEPHQRRADAAALRELRRAGWPFVRVVHSQFLLEPDKALTPLWAALRHHGVTPLESDD